MAALTIVLALKLPVLGLTFYGDEYLYARGCFWLWDSGVAGLIPWWTDPTIYLSHPPTLFAFVAPLIGFFGYSPWPAHLLVLALTCVMLLYTRRLGEFLGGPLTGSPRYSFLACRWFSHSP